MILIYNNIVNPSSFSAYMPPYSPPSGGMPPYPPMAGYPPNPSATPAYPPPYQAPTSTPYPLSGGGNPLPYPLSGPQDMVSKKSCAQCYAL